MSVNIYYSILWFCKWATKTLINMVTVQADQGLHCPQLALGPFSCVVDHIYIFLKVSVYTSKGSISKHHENMPI